MRRVSLTFDDGSREHYRTVLPELDKRGMKGTFFIPCNPIDLSVVPIKLFDDHFQCAIWKRAAANGQEIGAHSLWHEGVEDMACWDYDTALYDAATSKLFLESLLNTEVSSYAYPKGFVSEPVVRAVSKVYKRARTCESTDGLSSGPTFLTPCWNVNEDTIQPLLTRLQVLDNKWLPLMFHCVNESNGWDYLALESFQRLLNLLDALKIDVIPFGRVPKKL